LIWPNVKCTNVPSTKKNLTFPVAAGLFSLNSNLAQIKILHLYYMPFSWHFYPKRLTVYVCVVLGIKANYPLQAPCSTNWETHYSLSTESTLLFTRVLRFFVNSIALYREYMTIWDTDSESQRSHKDLVRCSTTGRIDLFPVWSSVQYRSLPCLIQCSGQISSLSDPVFRTDLFPVWSSVQDRSLPCLIQCSGEISSLSDPVFRTDLFPVWSSVQNRSLPCLIQCSGQISSLSDPRGVKQCSGDYKGTAFPKQPSASTLCRGVPNCIIFIHGALILTRALWNPIPYI
jgi:hypothetical protein